MAELKYKELTGQIIGAAMEVHNELGNGFPEAFYQRALAKEMESRGITFQREFYMQVFFKGCLIGRKRVDFFIARTVMLELKAVNNLESGDFVKAKNYLEAYNIEVGLLINFGALSLEFKRIQNLKYYPKSKESI